MLPVTLVPTALPYWRMYRVLQRSRASGADGAPQRFSYAEIRAVATDHDFARSADEREETVEIIQVLDGEECEVVRQMMAKQREAARSTSR